jgi:hypothetical protein
MHATCLAYLIDLITVILYYSALLDWLLPQGQSWSCRFFSCSCYIVTYCSCFAYNMFRTCMVIIRYIGLLQRIFLICLYSLHDDGLKRWNTFVEEAAIMHDNVVRHQSTNTTRSYTSKSAPVNWSPWTTNLSNGFPSLIKYSKEVGIEVTCCCLVTKCRAKSWHNDR